MAEPMPEILSALDVAWRPLSEAVRHLGDEGLESQTSAGWTAKELVAHVAFWDEAVVGVVIGMFRREALPDGWTFGSGYLPEEGQAWPTADEHNAREAAWARRRSSREVVARLESAHEQVLAILATVTEQEACDHDGYFSGLGAPYAEHQPELDRVISAR